MPTCLISRFGHITVQVSRCVTTSPAVAGLVVYSFLNTKCGKKMGADPFLPKAQMKTNKFELCLHLLKNEMHLFLKTKNKTEL